MFSSFHPCNSVIVCKFLSVPVFCTQKSYDTTNLTHGGIINCIAHFEVAQLSNNWPLRIAASARLKLNHAKVNNRPAVVERECAHSLAWNVLYFPNMTLVSPVKWSVLFLSVDPRIIIYFICKIAYFCFANWEFFVTASSSTSSNQLFGSTGN